MSLREAVNPRNTIKEKLAEGRERAKSLTILEYERVANDIWHLGLAAVKHEEETEENEITVSQAEPKDRAFAFIPEGGDIQSVADLRFLFDNDVLAAAAPQAPEGYVPLFEHALPPETAGGLSTDLGQYFGIRQGDING